MGLDSSSFERGLQKADKSVKGFVGSSMKAFGALAGVAGLGSLSMKAINTGSAISDLSEQLRINTESLQTLMAVADKAGLDQSSLERAMRNVSLRTQEAVDGNKRYAESFKRLGIDLKTFTNLPTEKKLEQIAQAYNNAGKSQEAFADIAVVLGQRAGPKMLEVLRRLNDEGLRELEQAAKAAGLVMSQETIIKMDEAADAVAKVKSQVVVLAGEILSVGMPAIEALGNGIRNIVEGSGTAIGRGIFMQGLNADQFEAKLQLESEGRLGRRVKNRQALIDQRAREIRLIREQAELEAMIEKNRQDAESKKRIAAAKEKADQEKKIEAQKEALERLNEEVEAKVKIAFLEAKAEKLKERKVFIKNLLTEQARAEIAGNEELVNKLQTQVELAKKTFEISEKYNISLSESVKLAKLRINEEQKAQKNLFKDEEIIKSLRLKMLKAEVRGQEKLAEYYKNQLELAKRILEIERETGATRKEAITIANKQLRDELAAGKSEKSTVDGKPKVIGIGPRDDGHSILNPNNRSWFGKIGTRDKIEEKESQSEREIFKGMAEDIKIVRETMTE